MREIIRFAHFLVLFFFVLGCDSSRDSTRRQGGVALSFDDHFIEEWYQFAPVLARYHAKATFFLSCPTPLSQKEVAMLRTLQQAGHEVGYHGTIHGNATLLLRNEGAEGYLNTEIRPGLEYLRAAGFNPTSYAHPGGNHTARADSVLLAQGFTILRDVAKAERSIYGLPLYHIPPKYHPFVYYSAGSGPGVDALLIDAEANISRNEIREALVKARDTGTVLMLFGHKPLHSAPKPDEYGFQISFMRYLVEQADSLGLRFYTMSELPALPR
ncbi:polysaccharide deacetylase family protein [Salmonirosea aquatica]